MLRKRCDLSPEPGSWKTRWEIDWSTLSHKIRRSALSNKARSQHVFEKYYFME